MSKDLYKMVSITQSHTYFRAFILVLVGDRSVHASVQSICHSTFIGVWKGHLFQGFEVTGFCTGLSAAQPSWKFKMQRQSDADVAVYHVTLFVWLSGSLLLLRPSLRYDEEPAKGHVSLPWSINLHQHHNHSTSGSNIWTSTLA
jgi:hypothetical protein